jgi:hypothetical protein
MRGLGALGEVLCFGEREGVLAGLGGRDQLIGRRREENRRSNTFLRYVMGIEIEM